MSNTKDKDSHTCMHEHINIYIHTYKHTYIHTYIHMTHTYLPTNIYNTRIYYFLNFCIFTFLKFPYTHIHTLSAFIHNILLACNIYLCTLIQTYSQRETNACLPTNIHSCMHTFLPRNIYNFRIKHFHNF